MTGRGRRPAPLRFLSPIHKATRQISIYLQAQMEGLGLAVCEGHLLAYLRSFAPCSVGELGRVFGYGKSTLTGILDRLHEAGLVTRTVNPADRRSFLVAITPEGKRKAAVVRKATEKLEEGIANAITETERKGFQRVMAAIADVTQVEVRPGSKPGS